METSITYIKCKNQQGSPLYHTEISMFLRGRTSQSAKYNKKSGKPYKDIDDLVDFGRLIHIVPTCSDIVLFQLWLIRV